MENSLTTTNFYENTITQGNEIYQSNPFFNDFINLMQNSEFGGFYKKYFKNWSDIETMIFYMKVYKAVEYGYEEQYKTPIDKDLMTFILHKIMTNNQLRKNAISIFNNFKDSSISDQQFFCRLLDYKALQDEKVLTITS